MKSRLVTWGKNEEEDSIILAYELFPDKKELSLFVFDFLNSNETFFQTLLNDWRKQETVEFPEGGYTTHSFPLTMTEPVLPEGVTIGENQEILDQARVDWHFVVLSTELFDEFNASIGDVQSRIEDLTEYSQPLWDELKVIQDKVKAKLDEEVLAWKHVRKLKNSISKQFKVLKTLRTEAVQKASASFEVIKLDITKRLDEIEAGVAEVKDAEGQEELKTKLTAIRAELKENADFPEKVKTGILKRVDFLTKKVKMAFLTGEEKEGIVNHMKSRLEGVSGALERAEKKINWLNREIEFQKNKISNPKASMMEVQMSSAKQQMYEAQLVTAKAKQADLAKVKKNLDRKNKHLAK